jgi:hypothetical protein
MNSYASQDEKIDVTQIRISQAGVLGAAVLGEFRAADRLLSDWADCGKEYVEVDFEVTFQDGYAYRGRYGFRRRSRTRPSLSKFVRRAFDGQNPGDDKLPPCPDRYLIEGF